MGIVIELAGRRKAQSNEEKAVQSNMAVMQILGSLRDTATSETQLHRIEEQIEKLEQRIQSIKKGRWV